MGLDWSQKPSLYKDYGDIRMISLPKPQATKTPPFGELLLARHSVRNFTRKALSLSALSFLLWASNGIRHEQRGYKFRTVPSARGSLSIESYVVANNVEEITRGVYHYSIRTHGLEEKCGTGSLSRRIHPGCT